MNKRFQTKRGLTLIEVMLAVVILGIGSGTLMLATARCIAVITNARHLNTANQLIHQVALEEPLGREEVEEGTESGKFDDGYTWERSIEQKDEENRPGLYIVTTRIFWTQRKNKRFEESVTYHYITPEEPQSYD